MLKIAIVEDHRSLREALVDALSNDGHQVTAFNSAETLWDNCPVEAVDIIILDLNLPGKDGVTVAKRIRTEYPGVGIIMLTARDKPEERRLGYESGADIYLAKPSSFLELTGSIHALKRRLNQGIKDAIPELVLDTFSMTLSGPVATVALSDFEVKLLTEFTRTPNNSLSLNQIVKLDDQDQKVSKSAIEVRIVRLRKKFRSTGANTQAIKVIRNFGYKLTSRVIYKEG